MIFFHMYIFHLAICIATERGNEGYVGNALRQRMEEKIRGIKDFKECSDFARTLNVRLQEKMMEANVERASALFSKAKVDEVVNTRGKDKADVRSDKGHCIIDQPDEEMLKEEVSQMEKAIKVLLEEYEHRKIIRKKNNKLVGHVSKIASFAVAFNQKKDTFANVRQTQLDEIAKYQKMKAEYHKEQDELKKKIEEETERTNEKEQEEENRKFQQKFREDQMKLSTYSEESSGGRSRHTRKGRMESTAFVDEDDDVVGVPRGSNRNESVKQRPKSRNSVGSMSEDNKLERKDSGKSQKGGKLYKERGQDMSRVAHTVEGVFYWDRIQNQKPLDSRGVTLDGVTTSYRKKYN